MELLRDLSRGELSMLSRLVDEVTASPGETVMAQGTPGYEVILLEEGRVEVLKDGERIGEMGPGELIGELAVLADGPERSATVIALSELRGLVFTAHFMHELHDRLPAVGARIDQAAKDHLARRP